MSPIAGRTGTSTNYFGEGVGDGLQRRPPSACRRQALRCPTTGATLEGGTGGESNMADLSDSITIQLPGRRTTTPTKPSIAALTGTCTNATGPRRSGGWLGSHVARGCPGGGQQPLRLLQRRHEHQARHLPLRRRPAARNLVGARRRGTGHVDLTAFAGAPPAVGRPTAFTVEGSKSQPRDVRCPEFCGGSVSWGGHAERSRLFEACW